MIMQAVESQAVESGERSRLSAGQVQRVVSEAARLYFESRRSRVNAFVERHFSLAGSLALHRKSLGWDVCLKTKSQTWRNCPVAGVVGALILFHLKNHPFAGKKAFHDKGHLGFELALKRLDGQKKLR